MAHRFWAVKLEPKQSRKLKLPPNHFLHITHAAVERSRENENKSGRLNVVCKAGRGGPQRFIVCTLSDTQEQVSLNLKISSGPAQKNNPTTQTKSKGGPGRSKPAASTQPGQKK